MIDGGCSPQKGNGTRRQKSRTHKKKSVIPLQVFLARTVSSGVRHVPINPSKQKYVKEQHGRQYEEMFFAGSCVVRVGLVFTLSAGFLYNAITAEFPPKTSGKIFKIKSRRTCLVHIFQTNDGCPCCFYS